MTALYAEDDAPTQNGLPPAGALDGFANPCPEDAPCTTTFTCLEADDAEATFEIEVDFQAPASR